MPSEPSIQHYLPLSRGSAKARRDRSVAKAQQADSEAHRVLVTAAPDPESEEKWQRECPETD
jgi:hypothetical protein